MRNSQKAIYIETKYFADKETGEVSLTESKTVQKVPAEPPYVKLYLDDLCKLIEVPKADEAVLKLLLRKLDYEGMISFSTTYRKKMIESLGVTEKTFRNRIQSLKNKGLIRVVGNNEYEANPYFFGRGSWADIYNRRTNGSFSMTIKYSEDGGREISTSVDSFELTEIKKAL